MPVYEHEAGMPEAILAGSPAENQPGSKNLFR